MTIHWLGTGLSAAPGLRRLLGAGHPVTVWNKTVAESAAVVGDLTQDLRVYTPQALAQALQPGDAVVSMLPADMHPPVAEIALRAGAHFVSSSYISPQMRALDTAARAAGVALVNEVGLDPGIDHLMAHDLVAAYRASPAFEAENELSFTSYCGGVPAVPNPFRYKFSWSPLGVLRALRSPARAIRDFAPVTVDRPWHAISTYTAPLARPESFEVYPNRDSVPFLQDYNFDPAWKVRTFVRGTLRLDGWARAWAPIFADLETHTGPEGETHLAALSDRLLHENAYEKDEADRVILCVSLRADRGGEAVFHQSWVLDAIGDSRGSAMARLVSGPVSLAAESVLAGDFAPGVHPAPHDPRLVTRWLAAIGDWAQELRRIDHLA